jgi:ribonuclease J
MIRTQKKVPIRKKEVPKLRFISLGGMEEIGRNCLVFEYENEIIVVDVGIQFPEEETPGIDYIIPNVSYLEPKKKNIKAIILTHGHYDHIHALPYLIEKLGNPVIYTGELTKELVKKRFEEFVNLPKPKIEVIKSGDRVNISPNFQAEFFSIEHTIPDACGFILKTPVGKLVHFGDFRVERDINGEPKHIEIFEKLGKEGIHSVFLDSTNADIEGKSISEETVEKNLEELFRRAKGRLIVATFASLLSRLDEIIKIAGRLGRKVALNGKSMKDNIQIARNLGYIKPQKDQVISLEDIHKYRDDKILILSTGGQGEPNAGLAKIANGQHKTIRFKPDDTVIFSSSVVPGNERSVQILQDNIMRQANEVYNSKLLDIHSSGHSPSEDLQLVLKLTKPKFVIPVYAYYFKRKAAAKIAHRVGIAEENAVLLDNGQVMEISKDSLKITEEQIPANYVMVDGLGIGDVEEVVLRDRRLLAQEGMVVIISTIDRETGRLLKTPDIISRGFIYLKENKELLDEIRQKLRNIISRIPMHQHPEPDYIKTLIRDQIGQLLYNRTRRRPMVLPVLIEV